MRTAWRAGVGRGITGCAPGYKIIPAPTVLLLASSMTINAPVLRLAQTV